MSAKRGGLGRNLSALLNSGLPSLPTSSAVLPLADLQPGKFQPRGYIDEEGLKALAESIKKQGLLQPIIVREIAKYRYEIIAGERRWRACQLAELNEIPLKDNTLDFEVLEDFLDCCYRDRPAALRDRVF
jgi:ParB family chromosome partitioning protein